MKRTLVPAILGTLLLVASTGCKQESESPKSQPASSSRPAQTSTPATEPAPAATQNAAAAPASAAGTHTHADGSTHAAHDAPAASHGAAHGGEVSPLGRQQAGGFFIVAMKEGNVVAGGEAVFLIGTEPASEALRVWIGDEAGTNAIRSKAEGGPKQYHAHAAVPSPLDPSAKLWIEVQGSDGKRVVTSFDLGTAPAASDHGHGHSHGPGSDHSH